MAFRSTRLHVQVPCGVTVVDQQRVGIPPYREAHCQHQHHHTHPTIPLACLDETVQPDDGSIVVDAALLPVLREHLEAQLDAVKVAQAKVPGDAAVQVDDQAARPVASDEGGLAS